MIKEFASYLVNIKGYATGTADGYTKDVRAFARWARANVTGARWSTITRTEIDRYVTALAARGLKPATTNRKLASIAAFYNWLIREGKLNENPCKYESRRKRPQTIPNTIPTEDLKKAYAKAQGVTQLILGLLMTTGMRIQEVLDMNWEDLNLSTGAIKVNGKGGKARMVYTTQEVLQPLHAVAALGKQSGRLFHLEQRQVRYDLWQLLRTCSSARQLSPHAIRHTFGTNMASQGANVSTLSTMLGHKHLETTQHYIDMTAAPIRQAFQQYNMFN